MARHATTDPEVRELVDALLPHFFAAGSVNGLRRRLAAQLAEDGSEGKIYPNRLHTLLDEDPSRGVNTQTIECIQTALSRLGDVDDADRMQQRVHRMRTRALAAWDRHDHRSLDRTATISQVIDELGLPRAAVRWLLGTRDRDSGRLPVMRRPSVAGRPDKPTPDWGFQDTAYEACLQSLKVGRNRKVGLVLPTGTGKTRVAMRILLRLLADSESDDSVVIWVTHRTRLYAQAHRELLRAINEGTQDLPSNSTVLLRDRVLLTMVHELSQRLLEYAGRTALVVVDEAHHAAAVSYQPLFEREPLRCLFLTATPNRTDELPIGIDEVAYTITYREAFRRGVIVEPSFEPPLTISPEGWANEARIGDLADYILSRAEREFTKTLVVTSRVDYAELLHRLITEELGGLREHPLRPEDVAFVHAEGSSTGDKPDVLLDDFSDLPRGILIATAQLLGEGFDDPSVNAVVMTFPTSSLLQLMQVAGRCVRYRPNKERAYIVQARDSDLAYHFEQRWLYRDISDALHPQLDDRTYASHEDLTEQVRQLLGQHHVRNAIAASILGDLEALDSSTTVSVLLTGLPFFGMQDRYADAQWSAVCVTPESKDLFLEVYNGFSIAVAEIGDRTDFLRRHMSRGKDWKLYVDMLNAMAHAHMELTSQPYPGSAGRGYSPAQGTTWLKYVTFTYKPVIPDRLEQFLADTLNRERVVASYAKEPERWHMAVKIDLPVPGTWGYLLDDEQAHWLQNTRRELQNAFRDTSGLDSIAEVTRWRVSTARIPVPHLLADRIETFLPSDRYDSHSCPLQSQ